MADKRLRRKSRRYSLTWKCAVVFDKADGRPVLHTQTEDLSLGGAAIRCDYEDLTGSVVTLLLAYPVRRSDEVPKMLKVRTRMVSKAQSPDVSGFRYGLSFVRSDDNGLDILKELLSPSEVDGTDANVNAETQAAAEPAAISPEAARSRLAQLRQLAMEKQLAGQAPDPKQEMQARVSNALEKSYRYLKEFTEQLNIVKPPYAKAYSIAGVPNFDGLAWKDGRVDCQVRELSTGAKLYEQVSLNFRLFANKQLRATRETPADEKLRRMLMDTNIEFGVQEDRNERGAVVRTTFVMPCEVKASLLLLGNIDTGKLLLKARNIERFGMIEHVVAPESVSEESLDELTGFILGESNRVGPLLLKDA